MAGFFVAFAYVVLTREFEQQKRASAKNPETPCYCYGAGGRNRTDTGLPPRDFESYQGPKHHITTYKNT
jgi:hypothetical protein